MMSYIGSEATRIYTGWRRFLFTDRLRRLKMYLSIPSCHGEGVSVNGGCPKKKSGSGPNSEITRIDEIYVAHQHL